MAEQIVERRSTRLKLPNARRPVQYDYDYVAPVGGPTEMTVLAWPGTYFERHLLTHEQWISAMVDRGHDVIAPGFHLGRYASADSRMLRCEGVLARALLKQCREASGDPSWQAIVMGQSRGALTALSTVDTVPEPHHGGKVPLVAAGVLVAPWFGPPRMLTPLYGLDILTSVTPPPGVSAGLLAKAVTTSMTNAWLHPLTYASMVPRLMLSNHEPLADEVRRSGTPMYGFLGEHDHLVGVERFRELCRRLDTQPRIISDVNHWLGIYCPPDFLSQLDGVLTEICDNAQYQPRRAAPAPRAVGKTVEGPERTKPPIDGGTTPLTGLRPATPATSTPRAACGNPASTRRAAIGLHFPVRTQRAQ